MGIGSGRDRRVGSEFSSAIAVGSGRVNVFPGRVGSGPRKVTRGQLCIVLMDHRVVLFVRRGTQTFGQVHERESTEIEVMELKPTEMGDHDEIKPNDKSPRSLMPGFRTAS